MLIIFTDTDTDFTPERAEKYGYKLISMPYSVGEKTIYPYVDFDEFDYKSFYDMLRSGVLPTTSLISAEKYIEYFEPYFAGGDDILYVHFSAAMTATFEQMDIAVKILKTKYPERKFYSVDTMGITIQSLCVADDIGEMYLQGKTPEEMVSYAKDAVLHYATYFFADDLKFFIKSGRVTGLKAHLGNIIGVRPIINMDNSGKMTNVCTVKGKNAAIAKIISYMEEVGDNVTEGKIYIGHTDDIKDALKLEEMIKEKFGKNANTEILPVNPTVGSHCGPSCAGVCFRARHR